MPTQTSNVSGHPYGISYAAAGETWKIAKGVDVFGISAGIYSAFANSTLVNQGEVTGGTAGVLFDPGGLSGSSSLANKASGLIGGLYGVYVSNVLDSLEIDNDGEIVGTSIGIVASGSSAVAVRNTGDIEGATAGIFLLVDSAGASGPLIENSGKIASNQYAVFLQGSPLLEVKIINHEGGLLRAPLAIVSQLQLDLRNEGKIAGATSLDSGNDRVVNKGNIGDLMLGGGDDIFRSKGDKAKAGLINTEDGNDLVVLGHKADKLLFDTFLGAATNVDTIRKFSPGKDAIFLDEDIFTTITPGTLAAAEFHKGTAATDPDHRIIYDRKSGALYYDSDGTGVFAQTQFAQFNAGTKLKAADFSVGEYSIVI